MKNIIFYKYIPLKNLEQFRDEHWQLLDYLGLKGKVLVATEGINGSLSGEDSQIDLYISIMHEDLRFSDIPIKAVATSQHDFDKVFVRIRPSIITSTWDADLSEKGAYIEPHDLKKALDSGEEIYLVDARNEYEHRIGRFKNAITSNIKTFSELPKIAKEIKHLKDKQIITYCTGGVRCEKASAYLKEQGFKHVRQLHGGIIQYGLDVGTEHWEGKVFVFDKRTGADIDPDKQLDPIARCEHCNMPCDDYYNCRLNRCDKRHIMCKDCHENLLGYCSKSCRGTAKTIAL